MASSTNRSSQSRAKSPAVSHHGPKSNGQGRTSRGTSSPKGDEFESEGQDSEDAGPTGAGSFNAGKHRTFYWVDTAVGKEADPLETEEVVKKHGVPQHIVMQYLKGELEGEAAVKSLPSALLLIVLFALMCLSHDRPSPIHSVEHAIDFDITENANFAFSAPGNMGHKNYQDVNNYADFWSWMQLGFVPIYMPSDFYVSEGSQNVNLGTFTKGAARKYLQYNRKIGPVKLSQQGVVRVACPNEEVSDMYNLTCSRQPEGALEVELKPTEIEVSQANYKEDVSKTVWLDMYGSSSVKTKLEELEVARWLNPGTSMLRVSILTYNADADILAGTDINFMFPASGHIYKELTHRTVCLKAYSSWYFWVFDALFYGQITFLFLNELKEVVHSLKAVKGHVKDFLGEYVSFWNLVDWISIILAYTILGLWIQQVTNEKKLQADLISYNDRYEACGTSGGSDCGSIFKPLHDDLETVGLSIRKGRALNGFYPVCIMARLFKAFAAQPRLAVVTRTLTRAAVDLAHFGIVFMSVFITYAVMGVAFFGREIMGFATMERAILSLFRALFGDFSVEDMESIGRGTAFFFFGSYMGITLLLLLNMLIAIIMDVYSEIHHSSTNHETVWDETWDIMHRTWLSYKGLHVPIGKVLAAYHKSDDDEFMSEELITLANFVCTVPGISQSQAEQTLFEAAEEFELNNKGEVVLSEVLSVARQTQFNMQDYQLPPAERHPRRSSIRQGVTEDIHWEAISAETMVAARDHLEEHIVQAEKECSDKLGGGQWSGGADVLADVSSLRMLIQASVLRLDKLYLADGADDQPVDLDVPGLRQQLAAAQMLCEHLPDDRPDRSPSSFAVRI
eukprot:CAMPEP_0115155712 /NCGR_PEP_ID=MMETSP0227-20121206/68045_1 /TAXON_ID=89957 /ORGANISM="Polarella glacialis, Strain CCMP 1383" /LENGTH=848 /DNA_ID=CAMNT_0002566815 /DNA_START=80 /DNA_END=2626 /DNA_ORIENTATION=+